MVDDFMVCVDRIIATACFDRATRGQEQLHEEHQNSDNNNNHHHHHHNHSSVSVNNETVTVKNNTTTTTTNKMLECRICQEEDEVNSMESPCACNGTLKFAHRKCIQRWCNKKGDITCEICNQVFSPNYSLPPRSNPDVMTIDVRQAWGPHIDLRDSHFLALAAAERQFLQAEYDEYTVANSGSIACLRSVALILLVILLVRQVLMVTRDAGMVQASSAFFHISLLQCAGFLLPCYVMARSWFIMQSRRRRQG